MSHYAAPVKVNAVDFTEAADKGFEALGMKHVRPHERQRLSTAVRRVETAFKAGFSREWVVHHPEVESPDSSCDFGFFGFMTLTALDCTEPDPPKCVVAQIKQDISNWHDIQNWTFPVNNASPLNIAQAIWQGFCSRGALPGWVAGKEEVLPYAALSWLAGDFGVPGVDDNVHGVVYVFGAEFALER